MSGSLLNTAVTALLRTQLQPEYWAFLSPQNLVLGDFGYVDSTGAFERLGNLTFQAAIGAPQLSVGEYSLQDQTATSGKTNDSVKGTFIDPEGVEVKVGADYSWQSTKSNSAQTTWNNATTTAYEDLEQVLSSASDVEKLWPYAKQAGYITGSGTIKTGFCVVGEIVQIYAGVAVVSTSSSSEYTIEGSVQGVDDLVSGQVTGSYTNVQTSSSVDQFTWPPADTARLGTKNVNPLHTVAVQLLTFDSHNNPIIYT